MSAVSIQKAHLLGISMASKKSKGMIILLYLPFENYEIESPLPPEDLKERFINNIETKMPLFSLFYKGGKKFKGKISEGRFLISRIIQYRNSFLPMIEGLIYPSTSGSKIAITMRLNKFVLGVWILWMAIISLVTLGLLPTILSTRKIENLIPLLMLVLGYFLCIIPFNIEVNKAKRLLKDITDN